MATSLHTLARGRASAAVNRLTGDSSEMDPGWKGWERSWELGRAAREPQGEADT